ncbi:MAG: 30S ribosome-binding factor RbfA [Oscillospiraceae bacterium]|jgi:ribosome-binding factor A|nr:30S ribosome-binding factor RbfA [Oscillospiraceae bacterium]
MPSRRQQRLNQDFKKELSMLLPTLKDPRIDSFLSVMRVDVTNDLSYAKVYIGSIGGYDKAKEATGVLKSAAGHLRSQLAVSMHIRKIPELIFVADDSAEYALKIDNIIEGFSRKNENEQNE